jgi:hypothetical protein
MSTRPAAAVNAHFGGQEERTVRKPLFKTTVVIWSYEDPAGVELIDLAREVEQGASFCSSLATVQVEDPAVDLDMDEATALDPVARRMLAMFLGVQDDDTAGSGVQ